MLCGLARTTTTAVHAESKKRASFMTRKREYQRIYKKFEIKKRGKEEGMKITRSGNSIRLYRQLGHVSIESTLQQLTNTSI